MYHHVGTVRGIYLIRLVLLSHYIAVSTLQLSDCTEFELIPPEQYDRNISAIDDITKRPLGYMFGVAQNPGIQSEIKNPCVYVKNLTSRDLEVKVSQLHLYIYYVFKGICWNRSWGCYVEAP